MTFSGEKKDNLTKIFELIVEICNSCPERTASTQVVERKVIAKGFKTAEIHQCYNEYTRINVLYLNSDHTEVTLIS